LKKSRTSDPPHSAHSWSSIAPPRLDASRSPPPGNRDFGQTISAPSMLRDVSDAPCALRHSESPLRTGQSVLVTLLPSPESAGADTRASVTTAMTSPHRRATTGPRRALFCNRARGRALV
jgi:hypothetical protein